MAFPSKCIHCGGLVSSEANECPHCGRLPRPFKPLTDPRPGAYAPEDNFTCPACGTEWTPDTFRFQYAAGMEIGPNRVDETQKCPNDGHPIQVYTCEYCRRDVFRGHERTVVHCGTTIYYHVACFNTAKPTNLGDSRPSAGCAIVVLCALIAVALPAAAFAASFMR